jgi:cyclopropane fatty-acyl-phospholipid synthase-like methyltransferase
MNFNWNANTIKWYREANAYSGFFRNVAALIAPKLEGYATFCDIGCGLGLVDLELSKSIRQITCIDINTAAIVTLKKSIEEQKIQNIETRLMDCSELNESWDIIYMSFFGSHELEKYLPHCKKMIAVVGKKIKENTAMDKYKSFQKNSYDKVEEDLNRKGIPYSLTEISLEFGQPLVSVEDAKNYIQSNYAGISDAEVNDFLFQKLLETNEKDYPFYIPKTKSIGIFEIKGDNR